MHTSAVFTILQACLIRDEEFWRIPLISAMMIILLFVMRMMIIYPKCALQSLA